MTRMNEQQNTREAAIEQAWFKHWDGQSVTKSGAWFELFTAGFLAGAASVDRAGIVEKFEQVKAMVIRHIQVHDSCHDDACPTHQKLESALSEMDAILAEMEKGNEK